MNKFIIYYQKNVLINLIIQIIYFILKLFILTYLKQFLQKPLPQDLNHLIYPPIQLPNAVMDEKITFSLITFIFIILILLIILSYLII